MTEAEHESLLQASRPVPYMIIGGVLPRSPYENAMVVWREVSRRVGCYADSIEKSVKTPDDELTFSAIPVEEVAE